ncbi:MAG: carbohydrate ABC transporter permease [Thermomicrobiales bacterium]|jgi:multiple sugar transport system permease protein
MRTSGRPTDQLAGHDHKRRNRIFRDFAWRGQVILLLLPLLVGMTSLVFLPALIGLPLAFTNYNSLNPPTFNGLQNFQDLWNDQVFHLAVRNTLGFIGVAVPLRLLGALAIAMLLHRAMRGIGAMRAAVVLPTVVPDIAWALAWLWIFNPLYGPLNLALRAVGIEGPAWMLDETGARFAIILMLSWQFGEGFVVCLAALSDIPTAVLDQARIDGAGPWTQFRTITLPLVAPYLLVLAMRDVLFSLHANFVPAKILGQEGGPDYATTYLPMWIYINGFGYLRLGYAAAMTWVTFLFTVVIVAATYLLVFRRRMDGWTA